MIRAARFEERLDKPDSSLQPLLARSGKHGIWRYLLRQLLQEPPVQVVPLALAEKHEIRCGGRDRIPEGPTGLKRRVVESLADIMLVAGKFQNATRKDKG